MDFQIKIETTGSLVRVSFEPWETFATGINLADALENFQECFSMAAYMKFLDNEIEIDEELKILLGLTAENMTVEDWVTQMDWEVRKPLFESSIAQHYPSLSGKYKNNIPSICWDAPKESSEDDKWLFANESAAQWDLIKNGPTGEIWCKFIRLLAPISWDPGGDWDKWEAAGLPLPPRPANLPAPLRRIAAKDMGKLGFIA